MKDTCLDTEALLYRHFHQKNKQYAFFQVCFSLAQYVIVVGKNHTRIFYCLVCELKGMNAY